MELIRIMSDDYNPFSLKGKNILITGASSGIGRATAIECSKMGAKVIAVGRNSVRLEDTINELEGEGHISFIGDLTQSDAIKELIELLPSLDGAVLAAGIGFTAPVKFSSIDKFKNIFETNLFSQTELSRNLFKTKKLKDGSSLVFISSVGGNSSINPGNAIYGASKAALNSYMKFCALEFASRKIRVNCVCPGMIETSLIRGKKISDEQLAAYENRYPLKRFGTAAEVAWGSIYLLSNASSWISGISLNIDGGGAK